jgi:phosphatidylglycerol:prolipoprotein diacylglycerol transferase
MLPVLFEVPAWAVLALAGGIVGAWLAEAARLRRRLLVAGAAAGVLAALMIGWAAGWLTARLPVQGYGSFILTGFLLGLWLARRRAHLIGMPPDSCLDLGLWGVLGGLAGARLLFVIQHWPDYSPFGPRGLGAPARALAIWEGGLVYFGVVAAVIPLTIIFCRVRKLPALKVLDLMAPSLVAGQALGRLGCFMRGCCFGKPSGLPWAVSFPPEGEAYLAYLQAGQIGRDAACSPPLHPTQLYACVSAALTAAFLYAYWPRRRHDGQVLALMLMLCGATRFFEDFLRADLEAALPALSASLTFSQYFSILLIVAGAALAKKIGTATVFSAYSK